MFMFLKKPLHNLQSSSCKNFPRVSGQDVKKKKPVHATNQIAGSGEFHPLTKLEKNYDYLGPTLREPMHSAEVTKSQ